MEVPLSALSPVALAGVIENFILREGTDYGERETSHEAKVEQIRRQLDRGDIKIVYDLTQQSVTLMTKRDWLKMAPPDTSES
ncbi:MAG: YheU family protein [Myxococcales bacterium]|nr:MAG: YheU family protein [Myxococcales bacterium]